VRLSSRSHLVIHDPDSIRQRIYDRIGPDLERVEREIQSHLDTDIPLISVVGRYIMNSGGKRLRPLLMILAAKLCGYRGEDDVKLAVVFELLHAATLLHDDVVDNAEVRRKHPAANTLWGNPAVVLVGDYLYSRSILMAVRYNSVDILEVLSSATTRMAEGEVLQLIHADNLEVDEGEYLKIIERKTAVLMSAACQIGVLFGGGSDAEAEAARRYGRHLGIAFQLVDDTLDYMGDVEELGKPVGNDIQEGKTTLPLIFALANGSSRAREELKRIFSAEEISAEDFSRVRELVTQAGGIEYTMKLAEDHVSRAKGALSIFPPQSAREILVDIADYVVCRKM